MKLHLVGHALVDGEIFIVGQALEVRGEVEARKQLLLAVRERYGLTVPVGPHRASSTCALSLLGSGPRAPPPFICARTRRWGLVGDSAVHAAMQGVQVAAQTLAVFRQLVKQVRGG